MTDATIVRRQDGEEYLTFEALLAIDDRPQADVRVPLWRGALVRVRALSLEQQEEILRAARIAAAQKAKQGDPAMAGPLARDWQTYTLETLRRGVLLPQLDDAQIYLLRNRNPKALEDLAALIWGLSQISQENIDALVAEAAAVAAAHASSEAGAVE